MYPMNVDNVNMVTFEEDEVDQVIDSFGLEIRNGRIYDGDEVQNCHFCEKELTPENLGNVVPGSELTLCDSDSCFSMYLVKYLM